MGSRAGLKFGRRRLAVTLTLGLLGSSLVSVVGLAPPVAAADTISFRASAEASYNQLTARPTVPDDVAEADALLLFVTKNKAAASISGAPEGWNLEGTRGSGSDTETTLFSKVATDSDAARTAAVSFAARTKSTLTMLAYDGTAAAPVATFASAGETARRTRHTTPVAQVGAAGSYVVSYWADKAGSDASGWSLPSGQTERGFVAGSGAGRISAIAADLDAPAAVGPTTPRTATSVVSSNKVTMWTVVLATDQTAQPNVVPVASFTVACPQATCTVDASASSDTAPGMVDSYAWDFGDGAVGDGVSTTHVYATGGPKTITLTVTDDQGLASAPVTRTATPTVAKPGTPPPGHDRLVPDKPRNNTPRINDGEIWDIAVIPSLNRVFIAGNFSSIQNTTGNTAVVNQAGLASYNYQTGLIDTAFRPQFSDGVAAVEATPDGTKLFVGGSFNQVNGTTQQKVASLDLTTGAPLPTFGFDRSTNNRVTALATTNSTLYVGGRFSRINGALLTGLAAVDAAWGSVDLSFDNQLSGGIGANGTFAVPQLKLTHDQSKLLVVHTGRKIDGQDRYGMGIIDTTSKELLSWRSTLWDDNLARVGGVTRIVAGDIAPDDSYFVVTSGSGGDKPPISDTAIAYPLTAASSTDSDVQPLWISRHFDSVYSVAITEVAVYLGGHFSWVESPSAQDPWPGLDNVGTAPARGSPAMAWATRWSAATTSPRSLPSMGSPWSGTPPAAQTPSKATRPCRPPLVVCSSAATACSRAASVPVESPSMTSTPCPTRRHCPTPRSPPRSRVEWSPGTCPSR